MYIQAVPYKLVVYSAHAAERMQQRGITRHDVKTVLARGEPIAVTTRRGETRLGKRGTRRGRPLVVIYLEDAGRVEVITTYVG